MTRLRVPGVAGRWTLGAGALVWSAVAIGRLVGAPAVAGAVVVGGTILVTVRRDWTVAAAALLVAGSLSGSLSAARESSVLTAPSVDGPVRLAGWAIDDLRPGRSGEWFLFQPTHIEHGRTWQVWDGAPMLVAVDTPTEIAARDHVIVKGTARTQAGRARGDPYAGLIRGASVTIVSSASDPLFWAGNAVRRRIATGLDAHGGGAEEALLSGFLIGDVRRLPPVASDQLRRSGLSHFVAVSGSNVALFLLLWWVIVGPFAFGPRRRAVAGLVGLAVFVVMTRWEPSVLRAAGMAGLLLVARAVGIALTPWVALGTSVSVLLLVSGELGGDIGFQLSVAATVGVMAGADLFKERLPRWVGAPLGVTVAAQLAVAPVLLVHFGALPLLSPLANLVASPLVMLSTASGGIGLLTGAPVLTEVGVRAAGAVLFIAKTASSWPQVGPMAALLIAAGGFLARSRKLRPLLAVVAGAIVLATVTVPTHRVTGASTVFLDVGQGDSELIIGSGGETVLIDGGPDPVLILRKLAEYGVRSIDLMVLSHPHDDHAAGLLAVVEHLPVGALWHSGYMEGGPASVELLSEAERRRVPVLVPSVGQKATIGDLDIIVAGPLRRYASPNDQSLVLIVQSHETTMLFPGDVERIAQSELGPIRTDVLKVPHQGADTSDVGWLVSVRPTQAIISVGQNTFGHPSLEVITALESAGIVVRRTDEEGDIVVPFR
ncbi:comEC family competence protein [bacterium BMS3Abin02]|nr:comEC family competence protein [bacterium BMS3Abin02]HDL49610.1 ComEC/Rec2 family competence protein [Actinomycetota bacterium]